MVDLTVTLAGVALKNPIIPPPAPLADGREYAEVYDLDILGAFSWKGTTAQARLGNPQPRIAEVPSGMLNAVGLQNPGIDAVIAQEVPHIAEIFHGPVIGQRGGLLRGGVRGELPEAGRCGPGENSGGKHLLSQRPRWRKELRL